MVTRKNKNKLLEWKDFVDTVRIKCVDLKDKFFALKFCGFSHCPDVRKGRRLPYAAQND